MCVCKTHINWTLLIRTYKTKKNETIIPIFFFYKEGISLKINKGYKGGGKQYLKSLP